LKDDLDVKISVLDIDEKKDQILPSIGKQKAKIGSLTEKPKAKMDKSMKKPSRNEEIKHPKKKKRMILF
jgi:hypothetical protein